MVNSELKSLSIEEGDIKALYAAKKRFEEEGDEEYLFDFLGLIKKPAKSILAHHMSDFKSIPNFEAGAFGSLNALMKTSKLSS